MQKEQWSLKRKTQRAGFTLVEILVAIVILGIGAIAVLGLQVAAVKSSIDAKYQSTALQLASDLSAMMRGNPTVASMNSSSNPYLINKNNTTPDAVSSGSGLASQGSASAIAVADIKQWYARAYETLPAAKVVVCFDANPYDSAGVPRWECSGSGATPYIKIGWSLRRGNSALDQKVPGVVIPVGVCNPLDANATAACVSGIAATP
ncbi:type IV pilus modification protein PilV [Saezia sanguinis]|nr:type IV pilus modification protein PilV [Saezia sanguinis]